MNDAETRRPDLVAGDRGLERPSTPSSAFADERPAGRPVGGLSSSERWALAILFVAALVLRGFLIARREFDTDEAQHFHVSWGWANGRVQYRDVWDNHMPLFHLATAPLASVLGERADVLVLARLAMLPLAAAMLLATVSIGASLWGRRVALWGAALLSAHAEFLNKSLEFRADDLWAAFWLAGLAVLVGGPLRPRRALVAGLLVGLALATSLKTLLLLTTLAGAALLVLAVSRDARARWSRRQGLAPLGVFVAAALAPAAIVFATFAATGLLEPFLDCTVRHNAGVDLRGHGGVGGAWWTFSGLLVALVACAWAYGRRLTGETKGPLRLWLLVWLGLQVITIETVWPVVARQDVLPTLPLAALGLAAALVFVCEREARRLGAEHRLSRALPVALVAAFAIVAAVRLPKKTWEHGARVEIRLLEDVLALTDRRDPIVDAKGETVFRDRALREVLELLTRVKLETGQMAERVREACIEKEVRVIAPERFPKNLLTTWEFFYRNYLPVARAPLVDEFRDNRGLWVVGMRLSRDELARGTTVELAIPARYVLVGLSPDSRPQVDDTAFDGARELAAGRHTLRADARGGAGGPVVLLWAQAVERGFVVPPPEGAP